MSLLVLVYFLFDDTGTGLLLFDVYVGSVLSCLMPLVLACSSLMIFLSSNSFDLFCTTRINNLYYALNLQIRMTDYDCKVVV